ncbi:hypothetical protein [Ktedonobacter racemifer]|nr:hypothetical protein [Ktedonobacter racemifer]
MLSTSIACIPMRYLRYILLGGCFLTCSLYLILGGAGVWWLWSGHVLQTAWHPFPHWSHGGSVYGIVILALLGINYPLFLGREISGGQAGIHKASGYVWWGVSIMFFLYLFATFGVMAMKPSIHISEYLPFIRAITTVFGPTPAMLFGIALTVANILLLAAIQVLFSRLLVNLPSSNVSLQHWLS